MHFGKFPSFVGFEGKYYFMKYFIYFNFKDILNFGEFEIEDETETIADD